MQVFVAIRLYGYMDTNTINKGKRGELIKNLIENKYVIRKFKKRGGGNSVHYNTSLSPRRVFGYLEPGRTLRTGSDK